MEQATCDLHQINKSHNHNFNYKRTALFMNIFLLLKNSNSACWASTKTSSSSSHQHISCFHHDLAENGLFGVKQQEYIHEQCCSFIIKIMVVTFVNLM
jgi:hypothetical protein